MTEVNKVRKCGYTASKAMEYIFAQGSDSELSDIESDSDSFKRNQTQQKKNQTMA